MNEQSPRFWARDTEDWPWGGLRPGSPTGARVATAVALAVFRYLAEHPAPDDPFRLRLARDSSFDAVLLGEVEFDFTQLIELERAARMALWPTAAGRDRAVKPSPDVRPESARSWRDTRVEGPPL